MKVRFKSRSSEHRWHAVTAVRDDDKALHWFARSVEPPREPRVAVAGPTHGAREAATSPDTADLARAKRDLEEILARERRLRTKLEHEHVAKDRFLSVLSHDLRGV